MPAATKKRWRPCYATDPLMPSRTSRRFAAVNALAYVLSLSYQTALGLTPAHAAIALAPLTIGT
jgi:hypothetical protein